MKSSAILSAQSKLAILLLVITFGTSSLSGCALGTAAIYGVAVVVAIPVQATGNAIGGAIQEDKRKAAMEAQMEGERIMQMEVAEARAEQGVLDASPQHSESEASSPREITATRDLTIALLPADGWALAGAGSSATTEARIHEFARKLLSESGHPFVDRSDEDYYYRGVLWTGGHSNKKLNIPYAVAEGQKLKVDGVLTFKYIVRGIGGAYSVDVDVSLVDVATGRVYSESGKSKKARANTESVQYSFVRFYGLVFPGPSESARVGAGSSD